MSENGYLSLLEVGRDLRMRSIGIQEAIAKASAILREPVLCDFIGTTMLPGMEAELRASFRTCLDADALGETQEAASAMLAIIKAREDMARLQIVLRILWSPDVSGVKHSNPVTDEIERSATRIINWFEREADRVEIPIRVSRILEKTSLPEELVALGRVLPEDWWVGKLTIPPPSEFRGLSLLRE